MHPQIGGCTEINEMSLGNFEGKDAARSSPALKTGAAQHPLKTTRATS